MPPKRKTGKKRKAATKTPPEDLIDDERRTEILSAFQGQYENMDEEEQSEDEPQLPLSHCRKALKRLGLEGIKSHEIADYFGNDDNPLELIDADQFLRYAAAKTLQKAKSDRAFQLMDGGDKGIVLIEDLQRISQELGENFEEDELQEMMEFIDPSGEGLLTPKHFFKLARQTRL